MTVTNKNPFDGSFFSSTSESSFDRSGNENEGIDEIRFKKYLKQEKSYELNRSIKIIKEIDRRIQKLIDLLFFDKYDDLNTLRIKSIINIYENQKMCIKNDLSFSIKMRLFDNIDMDLQKPSKSIFDSDQYHKSSLLTSKPDIKHEMINCPEPLMISDIKQIKEANKQLECIYDLFDSATTEILPKLFLGRADSQGDFDLVILLTSQKNLKNCTYNKIHQFPGNEDGKIDFSSIHSNPKYLEEAIRLMGKAHNEKRKILVCCKEGKDLCALVLCAFLMKKYDLKVEQAYKYLNYCRPYLALDTILEDNQPYKDFLNGFFKGSCVIS